MRVYVFGSNEGGAHGAGAAAYAMRNHGAVWGVGFGRKGNSFAIPTKDMNLRTLPLKTIQSYVNRFIKYAAKRPDDDFQVTAIGCGYAGIRIQDMAQMFVDASDNCWYDTIWKPVLGNSKKYWGTWNNGTFTYTPEYEALLAAAK